MCGSALLPMSTANYGQFRSINLRTCSQYANYFPFTHFFADALYMLLGIRRHPLGFLDTVPSHSKLSALALPTARHQFFCAYSSLLSVRSLGIKP